MDRTEANADQEIATIRAATDGDRAAFQNLFHQYNARVYRTVYGLIGNEPDAREVSQNVWVKAWQKRAKYNFKSAYTTWLHRIAVNTSLDELRRRKRYWNRFIGMVAGDKTYDMPTKEDTAQSMEQKESHLALHQAIARLPDTQRTVLVLKEFENYTYEEIATTLNCKLGTVMSRLHLARKKLHSQLTQATS